MNILTVDIGGSSIKCGIIDDTLTISNRAKIPTPLDNMDSLFQSFDSLWNEYKQQAQGIAISMPGVIDSENGIAISGGALRYIDHVPFARMLKDRYQVPVWIGNDAKCAGLAEVGYGFIKGRSEMAQRLSWALVLVDVL